MQAIQSIWSSIGTTVLLLGASFLGAFALYVINGTQKRMPLSILSALGVTLNTPRRILIDMILSSFLGAVLVYILAEPDNVRQALIAGLGLGGILSAYTRDTEDSNGNKSDSEGTSAVSSR